MALRKHGFLFKLLLSLAIIIVILGAAVVVLFSCTPRQLGLAKVQLTPTYTVDGLGIADIRFGQIYSLFKSVTTQHLQSDIAPNAFIDADGLAADKKFQNTLLGENNGKPNYEALLVSSSGISQPLVLKETELAYVVNQVLQQFYASPESDIAADALEAIEVLKKLDASVVEATFFTQGSANYLKIVLKLNVAQYVAELNQQKNWGIADFVYCTITNQIDVGSSLLGLLGGSLKRVGFESVVINDQSPEVSLTALDALFKATSENDTPLSTQEVDVGVCLFLSYICQRIGGIGTQSALGTNNYGIGGINFDTHEITFLPKALQ